MEIAITKEPVYMQMDGKPHIWIRTLTQVAVVQTLENIPVGGVQEFSIEDINIGSIRSVAKKLERRGEKYIVTNPLEDNWQTCQVVRVQ